MAETIIDDKASECNCRRYKYSLDFVGPIAQTLQTHPIHYCQKLVGNLPDEYIRFTNFLGDLRKDLSSAR